MLLRSAGPYDTVVLQLVTENKSVIDKIVSKDTADVTADSQENDSSKVADSETTKKTAVKRKRNNIKRKVTSAKAEDVAEGEPKPKRATKRKQANSGKMKKGVEQQNKEDKKNIGEDEEQENNNIVKGNSVELENNINEDGDSAISAKITKPKKPRKPRPRKKRVFESMASQGTIARLAEKLNDNKTDGPDGVNDKPESLDTVPVPPASNRLSSQSMSQEPEQPTPVNSIALPPISAFKNRPSPIAERKSPRKQNSPRKSESSIKRTALLFDSHSGSGLDVPARRESVEKMKHLPKNSHECTSATESYSKVSVLDKEAAKQAIVKSEVDGEQTDNSSSEAVMAVICGKAKSPARAQKHHMHSDTLSDSTLPTVCREQTVKGSQSLSEVDSKRKESGMQSKYAFTNKFGKLAIKAKQMYFYLLLLF